jgi:hypothetical protein
MAKETKLNLYEVEIVKEYNGTKVDPNALVAKITSKEETFHIFILPNYQERWVRFGCDSNTDFAQQVTQLMMESGEAEFLIKQVYDRCFSEQPISVENGLPTYQSSFDSLMN